VEETTWFFSSPLEEPGFVAMVGFRFPDGLSFVLLLWPFREDSVRAASSSAAVYAAKSPCDFGDDVDLEDEFAEAGIFESEVVVPLKKL